MPACQVGNLEYALSLDPSNTLLQKRLSEAKVGCLKVMDFFGIIFVVGRGWWCSFREENQGFRFWRISGLRRSLLLVMFRTTATGFWGLLLMEEILHHLGYLCNSMKHETSSFLSNRENKLPLDARSLQAWTTKTPSGISFLFCSIPLAIEIDQACCPYWLILIDSWRWLIYDDQCINSKFEKPFSLHKSLLKSITINTADVLFQLKYDDDYLHRFDQLLIFTSHFLQENW